MLTVADYFKGHAKNPYITEQHRENAEKLIEKVNGLLLDLLATGRCDLDVNPVTKTLISGKTNGGWRPQDCPEGAASSSHKEGRGVDIYDLDGDLDTVCDDNLLEEHGLYREHPSQTRSWMHLTDRAPRSGSRTFYA
jgi:hypothetical protein